jgi:hypothetical protein
MHSLSKGLYRDAREMLLHLLRSACTARGLLACLRLLRRFSAEALANGLAPQVRAAATLGGNLVLTRARGLESDAATLLIAAGAQVPSSTLPMSTVSVMRLRQAAPKIWVILLVIAK